MAREIDFKINVDVDTEQVKFAEEGALSLRQKLKLLREELQKVPADSKQFAILTEAFNDTKDAIDSVNAKSTDFVGTLGLIPGPIGQIGSTVDRTVGSLKTFSTVSFDNVKTGFKNLLDDVVQIGKRIADVTGITKVYTVTNELLSKSFVAVGISETAAAAGAKAFAAALTATGIGAIVVGLGLLIANWDKVTDAIKGATLESKTYEEAQAEVTKSVADFQKKVYEVEGALKAAREGTIKKEDALKKYNDTLGETVGYAGSLEQAESLLAENTATVIQSIKLRTQANVFYAKSAEQAAKAVSGEDVDPSVWESVGNFIISGGDAFQFGINQAKTLGKNYAELSEKEKKFAAEGDKLTQQAIENDKKLKKGLATPPDFKATADARKKALEEIEKNRQDALQTVMKDEQKEIAIVQSKYKKLIDLAKEYGQSTKELEAAQAKEIADIKKKYVEKTNKENLDKELAALELRKSQNLIGEQQYQQQAYELKKKYANNAQELIKAETEFNNESNKNVLENLKDFISKKLELSVRGIDAEEQEKMLALAKYRAENFMSEEQFLQKVKELGLQKASEGILSEEEYQLRLAEIQKGAADARLVEIDNAEAAATAKVNELRETNKISEEQYQAELTNINDEFGALRKEATVKVKEAELATTEAVNAMIIATEKYKAETLRQIQDLQVQNFQTFGNLLGAVAGKNKGIAIAGIVIEKGAAIAKVVVDTARAISSATAAAAPFMANPITAIPATANLVRVIAQQKIAAALSVAGIVAGAVKGISEINQTQIPGQTGGSSAGGSAGGGGGAATPTIPAPQVPSAAVPQAATGVAQDPSTTIAKTIAQQQQKPLQAFVVSTQVTSQQSLDRRVNRAATL